MESTILGVILLIGRFRTILTAPVVPAQQYCSEGEPLIGKITDQKRKLKYKTLEK